MLSLVLVTGERSEVVGLDDLRIYGFMLEFNILLNLALQEEVYMKLFESQNLLAITLPEIVSAIFLILEITVSIPAHSN